MRKSFKALLCATALVGAMTSGRVLAVDLTVDGDQTNSAQSTYDNITVNSGTLTNEADLTSDGLLDNNASIVNNSTIITQTIDNAVSSSITGDTGNLTVSNGGTNAATITQNNLTLTGGSFTNSGTITSLGTFINGTTMTGSGALEITAGQSTGSITQNNITIGTSFTNNAALTAAGTLTNNGALTNNSSITAAAISNATGSTITGNNGTISVSGGSNAGSIAQSGITIASGTQFTNTGTLTAGDDGFNNSASDFVNNSTITSNGTFTNTGSITGSGSIDINAGGSNSGTITQNTIAVTGGTFTNNNSIVASTFNNSATVGGTGSLEISGGTNASGQSITQNTINVTGNYTNAGSMTANNTFTNNSAITGAGSLTIADASGNSSNTGSISQATVEISGNKFTNNGGASITTTDSFTNSATDLANNGLITSNGTFTNNSGAEITGNGSLVIGNGGTNAGNITQDSVSVTGDLNHSGSIVTDTINIAQGSSIQANGGTAGSLTLGTGTTTLNSSNAGSITVGEFTNNANSTLNGSGSLSVTSGSNAGTISQDSLTVAQGASGDTFTNSSNINTNSVTNSGSLSNSGTIDTNTVSNSGAFTNSGSIGSEGNAVDTFTNSGTFTNEGAGSLIATTIENRKDATFTNNTNNVQAGTFNNDGTVEGAGSLELGSGTNTGSITQDAITIATGGSLTSQGDGTNSAIIEVNTLANGGSVTLDNSILNVLTGDVTTGTINAINSGNELNADLSGGNLNIGYNGTAGSLKQTGGSVTANTIVDIAAGSTYDINAGSITIDNGDNWEGKITLTGGSLTTVGFTEEHGVLDADTGSLSITNSSEIIVGKDSSIAGDVATTIDNTSTLNINNGGSVVLNSGDDWAGTIVLGTAGDEDDTSSLDISGLTQNGTLQANSGTLDVGTGDLNISTGSYIENAVRIETEGNINITGTGIVGVDDNDTLSNSSVITLTEQGILNYGNTTDPNFKIEANSGNLNLLGGSKLTIDGSSSIADAVVLDIQQNSQLTLDAATLNLDNADRWDGKIINEEGTINANGLINDSQTASLEQTGGVLNVYNDAQVTLGENSFIQDGEINIYTGDDGENGSTFTLTNGSITGGDMTIDENSAFIVKNGTFALDKISGNGVVDQDGVMHAALVNVANGERVQHNITELAINGQTNFNIDIHARGNHYTSNDQFVVSSMTGGGIARIDNWSLNGDIFGWDAPIDRHITLDHIFVDENGNPLEGNIEITRRTEFTPIGYYQLNQKGSGAGLHYTLDLVDFNPQVFRGQVATVAQWMNQLAIDDMLFTHSMVLPSFKEEDGGVAYSGVMANRYASSNPLFAPYQYSRKDGGLWYKMYGTFENLNMNVSGLGRVGNNAYGALIGADFGLKELKNGWKFMPTAYIGYNGAHQAYPGVGAFQNGGQAGFLGTWYKNNFIVGGLVYGGVYENSMDVGGHTDNAFNYFAGAATKLAYNWRFHRDWVLQPNLMAAYNFFGQQNWHSDYGQMGMMSGMLNGVNLAPGVNLIWEKETFSIYGTLQYMYNLNGAVGGRAGNVGLPQVEMERGYIQYGLGFTKRWGDRFSGYLQAVLRNVGRTGVGFQLGFNILLGK